MRSLLRQHLAAVAFVILALGNVLGWRTLQAEQDSRAAQLVIAEALRCVDRWELHDQTQAAIEAGARIPAEALIEVASDRSEAEVVERYAELVESGVAAAGDELEDPECDLSEARDHLD